MLHEQYLKDDTVISSLQERLFQAQESGDASKFNFDLFRLEINSLSSESAHLDADLSKKSTMLLDEKIATYMDRYGFTPGNMVEVLDEHIADVKSSGASYSYRGRKFFLDLGAMTAKRKSFAMAIQRNARQSKQFGGALNSDDSETNSWELLMSGKKPQAGGDLVGQLRTLERDLDALLASLSSWYLQQGGLNINRLVEAPNAPQDDDCVSNSNGGGCSILKYEFEPSFEVYESRDRLRDADQDNEIGETQTLTQDEGLNDEPDAAEMLNQPIGGVERFPDADARTQFMGNFMDSLEKSINDGDAEMGNFMDSLERSFNDGDAEPEDERKKE